MHMVADVDVQKILWMLIKISWKNKKSWRKGIFCVDFVGAIGSGKTSLIEDIIDNTDDKIGVIAGDIISKFDAGRIKNMMFQ